MSKDSGKPSRDVETKVVKTADDTFSKNTRTTYQGPKGPVDSTPGNTINPMPTQNPASSPAPATDQGGGGGSDK